MAKVILAFVFLMVVSASAMGASKTSKANKALQTALTHAQMAKGAPSLSVSQTHLHHVINCLVGPKGITFDASYGNPCKGDGEGVINEVDNKKAIRKILKDANKGLEATKLDEAHQAATATIAALNKIEAAN